MPMLRPARVKPGPWALWGSLGPLPGPPRRTSSVDSTALAVRKPPGASTRAAAGLGFAGAAAASAPLPALMFAPSAGRPLPCFGASHFAEPGPWSAQRWPAQNHI